MPPTIPSQAITFENNRAATAVLPPANTSAADILAALKIEGEKAVLLVIGGADDIDAGAKSKLTQLFGRGIARAAANANAVIIDGGTKAGVMEMMGQGVADRGFQSPLIGVAPVGRVSFPGGTGAGESPLDSNHSNFVLVPGDAWGSETSTIFQLVAALRNEVPAVALLAAGGPTTRNEVLQAIRQNLPLIVIEGSGGFADEVAAAWKARPTVPDDPLMAEIVADGRIELHVLGDSVKAVERLIIRELGGDNVLLQAWDRFAVYDLNAMLQRARFERLQKAVMAIGFLVTVAAVAKERWAQNVEPLGVGVLWFTKYALVISPIVITVLITAANKFKQGNKWLLLRAGAEAIKREIYRYRSRSGDYKEMPNAPPAETATGTPTSPPTPEQVLAQRIEDITRRAMRTEVNASALLPYDKEKDFPPYVKDSGDDGYSVLSPDRYVQVRLDDQLGYYKRNAVRQERKLKVVQWAIYIIGGAGTLLAAINQQVWIAVTTALATALTTYLSYQGTESTLTKYNQAFTDLDNVKSWWTALPAAEQAKQENVDTLVDHTEQVLQSELDGWVQQMQNALAELRKGQEKAPETADGASSTPAVPGAIATTVTTKTGDAVAGANDAGGTANDAGVPANDADVPANDAGAAANDADATANDADVPANDADAAANDADATANDADATANDADATANDADATANDADAAADDTGTTANDTGGAVDETGGTANDVSTSTDDAGTPADDANSKPDDKPANN